MKTYEEARKKAAVIITAVMCLAVKENDFDYVNGVVKGIASGISIAYGKDPNEVFADLDKDLCGIDAAGPSK